VVSNAAETALENIVPDELKVEIVSAINATTVEVTFNQEVTAEDGLTFSFDGSAVAAENVAYDGSTATLTVAEMADDTDYAVVVSDSEGNELVNQTVAFDYNEITTLTTDADSTINAVVGTSVSVNFTVEDEDEDGVEGTEVRVRAINAAGDVVEEQVLTTDANGQVTFTYTSIDGRTDTIEAVVLEKPTLRDSSVTVEWVETAASVTVENPATEGFIVSGATNVADELKTIKYVATFTDENGQPLADNEVVSVKLTTEDLTATSATVTLTSGATSNNEFTLSAGTVYTATLANGDGTAVLEFTVDQPAKVTPLFFVDANDDAIVDNDEPRAEGATVEVVDGTTQEPTFTLELKEVDEDNNVNTKVEEVDGVLQVQQGSTVEYTLTAVDQYGNPFIGTAQLSHKNLLDNLAGNDGNEGSIDFAVDEVNGGDTTPATTVTFDTEDTDADGTIELRVQNGAVGDLTNLVVWFDADTDGNLDTDEVSVETQTIEFVAVPEAVLTSMDIEADATTVVADGTNEVEYTVELLDADGNALDVSGAGDSVDVIVELYQDGDKLDQSSSATKVDGVGTLAVGTYGVAGENVKITGIDAGDGKFDFTVLPAAADAGSEFYPVVYVDVNSNGTIEADETITVQGAAFTATAEPASYEIELSTTEVTAGDTVDITITALDSTSETEVNFDGEHIVEVLLAADTTSTAAPAKTYLRTANFVDGVATVTVPVELVANDDVLVSITVNGTTNTADFDGSAAADNDDGDLTIEAGEPAKLVVDGSNNLLIADQYGNTADSDGTAISYNFKGIAKVTNVDGTFNDGVTDTLVPDAEGNAYIEIVDGKVTSDGTTQVYYDKAGTDPATLTLELANGDTFSVTVE